MLSRRELGRGMGLLAGGALLTRAAEAQVQPGRTDGAAMLPYKGPWTETGTLRRGGGQLFYAKAGQPGGNKPPVILLHKLGGWMSDWRDAAGMIAAGRQVIVFDLPGHGGSRWDGAAPYIQTLGETASLLVGALDEMNLAQVDVVGTSLGGCVAVSLAAHYPERVHRLAVVSSALNRARSLETIAQLVDKGQTNLFDAQGLPMPTEPLLLKRTFGIVNYDRINVEGIASRKAAGRWIQPSERGVAITDLVAQLERVQAQTLLLYGALDPNYIRFRVAAETALRRSRTEYVPGAGAFVMQDNAADTARILSSFLDNG